MIKEDEDYKQMAALMHLDIELLWMIAQRKDVDLDLLIGSINLLKTKRDDALKDKKVRDMRTSAITDIFALAVLTDE